MSRAGLIENLYQHRLKMTPAQRRASYNQKIVWRYPSKAEKMFYNVLSKYFKLQSDKILLFMRTKEDQYKFKSGLVRKDSFESELEEFVNNIERSISSNGGAKPVAPTPYVYGFSASNLVKEIMIEVRKWNEQELENYFNKRLGKILPYTDDWWGIVLPKWEQLLAERASGTLVTYLERVKELVLNAVANKVPFDKLVEQIKSLSTALTTARAAFLARDLTGTYNSIAQQQIHTNILGINHYLWSTAFDERVRGRPGGLYPKATPSHWDMQNKVCKWADPLVYSDDGGRTWKPREERMPKVHTGIEWQCRCAATPYDIEVLKDIDKRIALLDK